MLPSVTPHASPTGPGATSQSERGPEATLAVDGALPSGHKAPRVDEPLVPGSRLGRYVIEGQLGQGGMGTVFTARDPDLDRKVAVKVLHAAAAASDTTEGPQRLLREAQAMARLSHPNVVAVHDVGVVGSRLFIAMELVEGSDLRAWLATPRSWRAVVEVFVAAGAGLAAAHDAGIIHRDFKPDNVFIARNGRVLVGDFGIAAATTAAASSTASASTPTGPDPSLTSYLREPGSLTVAGAMVGTPAYMAPEQMAGSEITPAVDTFAFCVALYEAIHGRRPYQGDTVPNLFFAIHSEELAPPTAKVPRRLSRTLRRGLAADPGARHPSMHALLAELRPLIASRRRLWLGAAALVAVTGGASAALWSAATDPELCRGGDVAIAELWSPARRDALGLAFSGTKVAHAANTWKLVATHIDAVTAAWSAARVDACEDTHVRGEQSPEALDRRMVCLDRQLVDLDRLLNFLGEPDVKVVDHAVGLVREIPSPAKCDAVATLAASMSPQLAQLDAAITHARFLHRVGKYSQAIEELQATIVRLQDLDAPGVLTRAVVARAQAGYVDEHPDAQAWTTAALAMALQSGEDFYFAEVAANQLGLVGTDVAARELWLRLGEAAIRRYGGHDSMRAKLLTNYGVALRKDGRLKEAEATQRTVLELRRRDADDKSFVADALFNISAVVSDQGRLDESLALAQEALEIWTRELGPQHPRIVRVLASLAVLAQRNADYDLALRHGNQARELARALRGEKHPEVGQQEAILGTVQNWRGDFVAAAGHFERALTIMVDAKRSDRQAGLLVMIASFRVDTRDLGGAEAALEQARALTTEYPANHPIWTGEATARAQIALLRGQLDTAEHEAQRLQAQLAATENSDAVARFQLALIQAELHLRRGRFAEALAGVEPLATEFAREFKHPYIRAQAAFLRAQILWQQGRHGEALAAAEEAHAYYASLAEGFVPRCAEVRAWIVAHPAP
jgi:tetratricopeptide (TPR) repeat protein